MILELQRAKQSDPKEKYLKLKNGSALSWKHQNLFHFLRSWEFTRCHFQNFPFSKSANIEWTGFHVNRGFILHKFHRFQIGPVWQQRNLILLKPHFTKMICSDHIPGDWEHWSSRVEEYLYPKDHTPDYLSILVPNVDNVRTDFLIDTISKQGKVCMLRSCWIFLGSPWSFYCRRKGRKHNFWHLLAQLWEQSFVKFMKIVLKLNLNCFGFKVLGGQSSSETWYCPERALLIWMHNL